MRGYNPPLSDTDRYALIELLNSGRYRQRRVYSTCSVCDQLKACKIIETNTSKRTVCLDCIAELTNKENKLILALITQHDKDVIPIVIETNNDWLLEQLLATDNNHTRNVILVNYLQKDITDLFNQWAEENSVDDSSTMTDDDKQWWDGAEHFRAYLVGMK